MSASRDALDLHLDAPRAVPLDDLARGLISRFQDDLPLTDRPYAAMGRALGAGEREVLDRLGDLTQRGLLSRVGPVFAPHAFGWSTLAAMAVPASRLDAVATLVSARPEVNHNYEREHALNLWFVVTAPTRAHVTGVLADVATRTALEVLDLPLLEAYHIDLGFSPFEDDAAGAGGREPAPAGPCAPVTPADRRLAGAVEAGLALEPRPFDRIAARLGCTGEAVRERLASLRARGAIKRLGLVVRHHELGFRANAMVVMDVPDARVGEVGRALAKFRAVTLCYRRPRRAPRWPYNLFCMIHGRDRDRVIAEAEAVLERAGIEPSGCAVLFSRRRFKQRGARYRAPASPGPRTLA